MNWKRVQVHDAIGDIIPCERNPMEEEKDMWKQPTEIQDLFHTKSSAGNWLLRLRAPYPRGHFTCREAAKVYSNPGGNLQKSIIPSFPEIVCFVHGNSMCLCVNCINETISRSQLFSLSYEFMNF